MAGSVAGPRHLHTGSVPPTNPQAGDLWLDTSDPDSPALKVKVTTGWRVLANLGHP